MSRGPRIKQEEVDAAHRMKAEGKNQKTIAAELNRSLPTVAKLLLLNKTEHEQTESVPS